MPSHYLKYLEKLADLSEFESSRVEKHSVSQKLLPLQVACEKSGVDCVRTGTSKTFKK
jgi:hypothetical protein